MHALETEYKGVLYRSRLEARWAIFFDACKLEYVYEPECFILKDGKKYTPDFYLPKYDLYVEIKPNFDWLENEYHLNRYINFSKKIIILSGSYPHYRTSRLFNNGSQENVIFCPSSIYEPYIVFNDKKLNQPIDDLDFESIDYEWELQLVKSYRFWN